jgi:hypothetical protein
LEPGTQDPQGARHPHPHRGLADAELLGNGAEVEVADDAQLERSPLVVLRRVSWAASSRASSAAWARASASSQSVTS